MDEKNLDESIGDSPGAISDTRGPEVEKKKRDYDPVKEKAAPAREYSFSFSHNAVNADVKSRRQC
jgi:hypothetical protein